MMMLLSFATHNTMIRSHPCLRLVELCFEACFFPVGGHRPLPEALRRLALLLLDFSSQTTQLRIKRLPVDETCGHVSTRTVSSFFSNQCPV